MWLIFGGRLYRELAEAISEYSKKDVKGYGMVDEFEWKEDYKGIRGIAILDAGLHTLKDWRDVRTLSKQFNGVPILIYIRNDDLLPKEDIFDNNVKIKKVFRDIYINELVQDLEEYTDN